MRKLIDVSPDSTTPVLSPRGQIREKYGLSENLMDQIWQDEFAEPTPKVQTKPPSNDSDEELLQDLKNFNPKESKKDPAMVKQTARTQSMVGGILARHIEKADSLESDVETNHK